MRISMSAVSRLPSPRYFLAVCAATFVLGLARSAPPDKSQAVIPGRTFPKEGVTPNAQSFVHVIYWYHKKRVDEFGFQDYFQGTDNVGRNTMEYMQKAMEKRYPNLVVLTLETNEADVKAKVEQLKKEKRIPRDHVDVPQPDKIEPPKKVGRRDYSYDGGVTKIGPVLDNPKVPPEFAVIDKVSASGVILKRVQTHNINRIMTVEVLRDGKKVVETRTVPFQTYSTVQTAFPLKEDAGFDATGKKLSKDAILPLLKPGQTVLLASDPAGIDPAFLTILKPDTIILRSGPR